MKRSLKSFPVFIIVLLFLTIVVQGQSYQSFNKKVLSHNQTIGDEQVVLKKGGMKVTDYGSPPFNNPNYYYTVIKTAPDGVYYKQAGLSPDGTKIVAAKQYTDGAITRREVVLMNADGTGEITISDAATGGHLYGYMNPFWSDDGSTIGYLEEWDNAPNKLVIYKLSDGNRSYLYEPDPLGDLSINNPDFLGSSKTTVVFWDNPPQATGKSDLYIYDSITDTRTNITNSGDYKEYEPVSNAAGDKILYWSGETDAELTNTTHMLKYSSGVWTEDVVGFTPIVDSYWPYWSKSENYIGTTVMSTKDVKIYNNTGPLFSDLTGLGYNGGVDQSNFLGNGFQGPNGEIVITSNAGRTTSGRDIVIASPVISASPVNGAPGISITPTIAWHDYMLYGLASAGTYSFELYCPQSAPPGYSLVTHQDNIATTSYTIPGSTPLLYNTTYQWFVKGSTATIWRGNTGGNWGQGITFTTRIATPVVTAPTSVVSITPTAVWSFAGGTTGVTFDVDYSSNGGTDWNNEATGLAGTSTSRVFTHTLLYNQTYIIKVTAKKTGETNQVGIGSSFTTINLPPPTLTTPANTISGVSILPYFEWNWSGSGTVTYDLMIYDSNGTTLLKTIVGIGVKHYQLLETDYILLNNHTYNWIVGVIKGANHTISTASSFKTTVSALASLSNPGSGTTVYTYAPVLFSWYLGTSVGDLIFELQYVKDTESGGTPNAADWANVGITTTVACNSDLTLNDHTLDSGTKYWWRVITYRDGEVVSYSNQRWFRTAGGASSATRGIPSWPIGGSGTLVYTNTPTFYWYTNSGDLSNITFELLVDRHSGDLAHGSAEVQIEDIPDLSYTLDGTVSQTLLPGTIYYWKLITYYKKGDPAQQVYTPTTYATFKTNGTGTVLKPILSYPTGGVTVYTETPTLYWYLGGSSDGLTFEVSINAHTYTTTDLYLDLSTVSAGLTGGGTYSWTVRAYNGSSTITSAPASFKVAGGTSQGKAVASWPIGNPTIYETSPTLSWYVSGSTLGLTGFIIGFSTTSADDADAKATIFATVLGLNATYFIFGTILIPDVDARSFDISELSSPHCLGYGQTYYWTVLSYSATAGTSAPSSSSRGKFTIAGTTGSIVPVVSYPKGGVTISSTSATLSWYVNGSTTGIDHYRVIYSRRSDMDEADGTNTITAVPTDQFLPVDNLVPGATYYWKVASHNGTSLSSYSTTATFVVAPTASASIVVPLIGSPNNGVGLTTTSPVFSWVLPTQSSGSLRYELQYSNNRDMIDAKTISDIKDPSQLVNGLAPDQVYYWRVRSLDGKGQASAYSEIGQFSVNSVTAVEQDEIIPTQFELQQNYPNPFNPTTKIFYSLPQNSPVSIKIYDMLGREVKTLINQAMNAGVHFVDWNADNENGNKVTSGVYIYRITAGNFIATKKMIFIK